MNTFAAHTRSTAFAISLSQKMVEHLLRHDLMRRAIEIERDLATRYDWYKPNGLSRLRQRVDNEEDFNAIYLSSTVRALIKRGLVEIHVEERVHFLDPLFEDGEPERLVDKWVEGRLTPAGSKMVELLRLADFDYPTEVQTYVQAVPLHLKDRTPLNVDEKAGTIGIGDKPRDRRLDLMLESDRPFLVGLREES